MRACDLEAHDVGDMHNDSEIDERFLQDDAARWIKQELAAQKRTVVFLADAVGVERTALSKGIAGIRKFTYAEVAQIAHVLGNLPPSLNSIGKSASCGRLLPLSGNVNASVWRVRGTNMNLGLAPIEAIRTADPDDRPQHCYYVEAGSCVGEYAVCVSPCETLKLRDGDVVVVEEIQRLAEQPSPELSRLTLRIVQITEDGIRLALYEPESDDTTVCEQTPSIKIVGVLIGFFRLVRR
jgi:hypothetical protein